MRLTRASFVSFCPRFRQIQRSIVTWNDAVEQTCTSGISWVRSYYLFQLPLIEIPANRNTSLRSAALSTAFLYDSPFTETMDSVEMAALDRSLSLDDRQTNCINGTIVLNLWGWLISILTRIAAPVTMGTSAATSVISFYKGISTLLQMNQPSSNKFVGSRFVVINVRWRL